jgi:hypothetical protein
VVRKSVITAAAVILTVIVAGTQQSLLGQQGGNAPAGAQGQGRGGGQGGGQAAAANLPMQPTAVALPRFEKITGPGPAFNSSPAQWPGRDMNFYRYAADEYFVSGTANGMPYTTRVVVRRPTDNARFSGLVVAEPMHPIGAAHAFEYNSIYIMSSGHIGVEIVTNGSQQFAPFNMERYSRISVLQGQNNEILAQVGALIKAPNGLLAGLSPRKTILWGTSASSGIVVAYLPAHMVYRTPDMQRIYDGFQPTSNGGNINPVDVPIVQVPTQHEFANGATTRFDSDMPGQQFRVYQFPGMGHLDARVNGHGVRFNVDSCEKTPTMYPNEAYFSVALHHLLQWVDKGVSPPMADRVYMDFNYKDDGSLMDLDENGNARGGIRTPYVDLAVVKYTERNWAKGGMPPVPAWLAPPQAAGGRQGGGAAPGGGRQGGGAPAAAGQQAAGGRQGGGQQAAGGGRQGGGGGFPAQQLCNLSAWETPLEPARLRQMYQNTGNYVRRFEARLNELEKLGWSLPVYHDLIMEDARKVRF